MKPTIKSIVLVVSALLYNATSLSAQTIQGPSSAGLNSTYTYSLNDGIVMVGASWSVTKGTIVSTYTSGLSYYAVIKWTSTGTGSVKFNNIEGLFASMNVTINTCSTTPATPTVTNGNRCGTGTVTLSATAGSGGTGIRWYDMTTNSPVLATGNSFTTPSLSATTSYRAANFNTTTGCESTKVTVTATINASPGAPTGANGLACSIPSAVALSGTSGTNGTTLKWYAASTGGSALATATSYTTPSISTNTTYYISSFNATTNCESTVARVAVVATVNATPSAPAITGNARFGTGTLTLTATGAPVGGSYKWYTPSNAQVSSSASYTTPSISATQSNYAYAKIFSAGGCASASTWATATIYPLPVVSATRSYVVKGAAETLDAGSGYDTYSWKNSNNTVVATSQTYTTNKPDTYTVTVTKAGLTAPVQSFILGSQTDQMKGNNYIITNAFFAKTTNAALASTYPVDSVNQSIQYFDGLGRPAQTVVTQGSPAKQDIVQPIVYDAFGRESKKYLPAVAGTDGLFKDITFDASGNYTGIAANTYANNAAGKIAQDARPFSETVFEASPLNRPLKDYGPGFDWKNGSVDNPVQHQYLVNSHSTAASATQEKIIAWKLDAAGLPIRATAVANYILTGGYYANGQLSIKGTIDEQGNAVREYTNKSGQVVLKKVQAVAGTAATNNLNGTTEWALTYYLYDDFGNLRYVFQPELSKKIHAGADTYIVNATDLNNLAFQYKYDGRKRMVHKQVPGAKPVYLVYDSRDRIILTQDGNQRRTATGTIKREWLFTKYDILNRPVITGLYVHSATPNDTAQAQMQSYVNTQMVSGNQFYEDYSSTATTTHGYTNRTFPSIISAGAVVYTVTYYDTYDFVTNLSLGTAYSYFATDLTGQATNFTRVRGQVTGSKINILGSTNYFWSVNYYDDKYRTIQTISQNHKAGTDRVTNKYDFPGRLLETKRTSVINGISRYVKETYTYDHASRLLTVKHSTNGAADVMIVKNEYNEIGQLVDKHLHSKDFTNFKQSVDYRYNIRGWLTKLNESDVSTLASGETLEDYFGMELAYNNTLSNIPTTAAFNGNISATKWSTGVVGAASKQAYDYRYDALNRLKFTNHYNGNAGSWIDDASNLETGFDYDLNGNINALTRKGSAGATIDVLSYNYTNTGNKLNYVNDTGDATKGFVNGNTGTDDYAHDANGNLIKDKNKGITNNNDIKYNHLNLPREVVKGADKIVYIYDATGRKLAQQVYTGVTLTKTTDYVGEYVFENNALQFINHAEGRVLPDAANWEYQYHLKDHLGNVRVTFTEKVPAAVTATANFESSTNAAFNNYTRTGFDLVDRTDAGTTSTYVQWLTGANRVGVAKSFSVMPGDKVSISAWIKYMNLGTTSNAGSFINALAGAFGVSAGSSGEQLKLYNALNSYSGTVAGGQHPGDDDAVPKAFVTILLFNKDYVLVNAAWDQVSTIGAQTSPTVKQPPHDNLTKTITASEAGFAYVFVSNEHPSMVDVYFDDVTVTHTPSAIVGVNDYYPFGLTFNSYSRENSVENRYLYNQGAGEIKFNTERQFDLGLNVDQSKYRTYDYLTGRWWQVDPKANEGDLISLTPYNYSFNNPIRYNDPEGDIPPMLLTAGAGAIIGAIAGAGIAAYNGGDWGDVGKAALAGAVGGAVIGSGAGLLATGAVGGTGLMSGTIGVIATNAAVGMISGAAEETTNQVLSDKPMNTATIVKAATAGGAVNAVAGPLGKIVAGPLAKAAAPVVNAVTNTVAKSSSPLVVAAAQTATNSTIKAIGTTTKEVTKDATQKAVENKIEDKLKKN